MITPLLHRYAPKNGLPKPETGRKPPDGLRTNQETQHTATKRHYSLCA